VLSLFFTHIPHALLLFSLLDLAFVCRSFSHYRNPFSTVRTLSTDPQITLELA
jgi:hypothetical protein